MCVCVHAAVLFLHVRRGEKNSPVYSGAGEVPLEPVSHSFSPFGFATLLGVTQAGEFERLWQEGTISESTDPTSY